MIAVGGRFSVAGQTGEDGEIAGARVACGTGISGVGPGGDREPGVGERALIPAGIRCFVAILASRGEARGGVVRVRRLLVLRLVAGIAVGRHVCVVVCAWRVGRVVADRARERRVNADKREDGRMVEGPLRPARVGELVARLARRREIRRRCGSRAMSSAVVRLVARVAVGRVPWTRCSRGRRARLRRVNADEREERRMVERCLRPARIGRLVAILARRREPGGRWFGDVVWL